ncbi:MAG TPA: YtxH domain-containing protein [Acidimicrobiales bacterium]|nr:YtxH domain-containing protein [Acidimicrobiales bacterium]
MFKVLLFPFRALILFFKLSGVKGGLLFLMGIAVGLLIAPQTGPELRARIQAKLAERSGGLPAEQEYNRL